MTARMLGHRKTFHQDLLETILTVSESGVVSNADKSSRPSKKIARGIIDTLGAQSIAAKQAGQTAGATFEEICAAFVRTSFSELSHLRPGNFETRKGGEIFAFQQYAHLDELQKIANTHKDVATALGSDYLIKPDITISRRPEEDSSINRFAQLVDTDTAKLSGLRASVEGADILHASISCKWTIRSDRAQNARSEGLNLVRNRKGRQPHIAVITAEPLPSRIASLALGTGDIDCVYHFALTELIEVLSHSGMEGYLDTLQMMIEGNRLKDIADLPLDLAI